MRQPHSGEITDEFWTRVEPLMPPRQRDPAKEYWKRAGGGRRPVPPRAALAEIFFALRTSIPWNAPPERFGTPSPVYRGFRRWCAAGFCETLWKAGCAVYDEAAGIDWTWVSGDGCMTKAPLAVESVGGNPTGRGKNGSKRHILVDGAGVHLALVATGANRHDVSRLEHLLDSIIIERPDIVEHPQHLSLDAGYAGEQALEIVVLQGFIPPSGAKLIP